VLVTLDTLRYDCVAGDAACMPRLAQAARDGEAFDRAYSATSSTQPSHASLLTGLHPWEHGVQRNGAVLADSLQTVVETLHAAGWWTGAVVASFPLARQFGFAQGFDDYDDHFTSGEGLGEWADEQPDGGHFFTPGGLVTDRALALLDHATGSRQFLWVHYFDAHAPYGSATGQEMRVGELRAAARGHSPQLQELIDRAHRLYDQDATFIDGQLGRLLDRLAQDEPGWETHVVITADHGESFGDDGFFAHGSSVSPAQVHVPLIVLSPRVRPGPREDVAGSVDVASTLLSLAGLGAQDRGRGRDLTADPPARPPSVFGMRRTYVGSDEEVRLDGSVEQLQGTLSFYAVIDDQQAVGNSAGVVGAPAGREDDLRQLFGRFEQELDGGSAAELLDAQTQSRLEALGYVR